MFSQFHESNRSDHHLLLCDRPFLYASYFLLFKACAMLMRAPFYQSAYTDEKRRFVGKVVLDMTPADMRQKLHRQIDQLPSDCLVVAVEFLEFLASRQSKRADVSASPSPFETGVGEPVLRGSTGSDLLQFAGTWQGDDFEECLEAAYEMRSPAEF